MTGGLILESQDDFALQAVRNARLGGTTGDIPAMLRIHDMSLEGDAAQALLTALGSLDREATEAAGSASACVPAHVAHACSLVGPTGVDVGVALAIAPVMDGVVLKADEGPHPGANVAWWEDQFTVWTPTFFDTATGRKGVGIQSDGLIIFNARLPESVESALPGRPLAQVVDHPMLLPGLTIRSARWTMGMTEIAVG